MLQNYITFAKYFKFYSKIYILDHFNIINFNDNKFSSIISIKNNLINIYV